MTEIDLPEVKYSKLSFTKMDGALFEVCVSQKHFTVNVLNNIIHACSFWRTLNIHTINSIDTLNSVLRKLKRYLYIYLYPERLIIFNYFQLHSLRLLPKDIRKIIGKYLFNIGMIKSMTWIAPKADLRNYIILIDFKDFEHAEYLYRNKNRINFEIVN